MTISENDQSPSPRALGQACSLAAVGVASLLWQVAAARATMAGLRGNELVLGLVLGCWLALIGAATAVSSRLRLCREHPWELTVLVLSLMPVGMLVGVGIQQWLPALTPFGEVVGPAKALGLIVACLSPACLLLGAAFGLVSLQAPTGVATGRWAAWVYLLESLGMVGAGVLFHLVLSEVSFRALALGAGLPAFAVALAQLLGLRGAWRRRTGIGAILGLVALLYLVPGLPLPGAGYLAPAMPGYQIVERRNTRHAALSVLRREDQLLFLTNGLISFTSQDDRSVESEVHVALLAHPLPRRVLMIGGGLGGGLREALKHPVSQVDYLELDPELVRLARRWDRRLGPALDDPRVRVRFGDGRRLVTRRRGYYDLILVGLPGPESALVNRFFTREFFARARQALRAGGMIAVSLEGSETYLGDEMALVHASVGAVMRRAYGAVTALPGSRTLLMAGRDGPVDLTSGGLGRRFRARALATRTFGLAELADLTSGFRRSLYLERLSSVQPLRNEDLRPGVYFHASLQWLARSVPGLSRALSVAAARIEGRSWLVPLAALVLALVWGGLRRRAAAGFAVGVAGLSGMAIELCLVLASQEIRGVIYHEIGALLTAFMVGLASGAVAGRGILAVWPRGALRLALCACALVAFCAVAVLELAGRFPGLALVLLLTQMVALGLTVGACFAPAASSLAARHGPSAAARAYAWDLVGAAGGAMAATIALPVLGLQVTCMACGCLCLGSALSLR